MDADLKARWVAALRSGKYKQTTDGYLAIGSEDDDGTFAYCCLGVLCEILAPGGNWNELRDEQSEVLSIPACDRLGIPRTLMRELTARNDGEGGYDSHPFDEIADVIEERL